MDAEGLSDQDLSDLELMNDNDRFLKQAKSLAVRAYNRQAPEGAYIRVDDVYIVWFAKVLQNWKALVSTDEMQGLYIEVTHNGARHESYIDLYFKANNVLIEDD
jgi:hypothetical protein